MKLWFAAIIMAISSLSTTLAQASVLDEFYGDFLGHAEDAGNASRDLKVSIQPLPDGTAGFRIVWTSVLYQNGHPVSQYVRKGDFSATKHKQVYSSAMSTNVFGRKIPHDPMQGEPYMWARLDGRTLYIYVLQVDEEGQYELQTYARTLTSQGLNLRYTDMRDNKVYREVKAFLTRVSGK